MCGRFTLTTQAGFGMAQRFGTAQEPAQETLQRFNVCPTEQVAVVRAEDGEWLVSTTILTTRANGVCAPVHDRMPCVLAGPDEEAVWLEGADDPELLLPCRDERVTGEPANPAVNRAGVEGPQLLAPPEPA